MSPFESFSTAFSSLNSQTEPAQSYDDAMEDTDDEHTPTQQSFGSSIPYSQSESPQSSDGYVGSDDAMEDMLKRYTQTTRSFSAVASIDSQGSDAVERDSDRVEKEERDRSDLFDEMIKQRVQEVVSV
ncbi:hypothetical protein DIS24_g5922 [Lasiodiplodia hormozganensis]|uniref:Uncharacterized protein n=1 Tax=Lasiodiplodia hormozganensis TaxID=869390 RepID=A0AA39YL92_9PEZI|nr:hypothetical protein DIS24_g5922 [Lasiodiplodia hormozganensis]